MKKYIEQLMILFVVFHAHAMEQVCCLSNMPKSVKDRIAYFLGWESKKAFLERTRINVHNQDKILLHSNVVSSDKSKEVILYPCYDTAVSIGLTFYNHKKHSKLIFRMPFAGYYNFRSLDFNQQGTYLLVRCFYAQSLEGLHHAQRKKKCVFFSFGDLVQYEKQRGDNTQENVLEEYLRHRLR